MKPIPAASWILFFASINVANAQSGGDLSQASGNFSANKMRNFYSGDQGTRPLVGSAFSDSADARELGNVADFGAKGDSIKITGPAFINVGQRELTLPEGHFDPVDVGKMIAVPRAGASPDTGHITKVAISFPGLGYTSVPSVNFTGQPTAKATPGLLMGVVKATIVSGGVCQKQNGESVGVLPLDEKMIASPRIEIMLAEHKVISLQTIQDSGIWLNFVPKNQDHIALQVPGCSDSPIISISMGLISVGFGRAYYGTGYGNGYQTHGVSMSLTGGGYEKAAVPGNVEVTPDIPPLETKITKVISATQVELADAAEATVNAPETITYGDDDTAAIQSAFDSAKNNIFFPKSLGAYWAKTLHVPSNKHIYGNGKIFLDPLSLSPLLDLSSKHNMPSSNIELDGVTLVGNRDSNQNQKSGASLIAAGPGATNINVHNVRLVQSVRDGMTFDGVQNLNVLNSNIDGAYYGAGILISKTTPSKNVLISNNTISNTQLAGVDGYFGATEATIEKNHVYGSNLGYGDSSPTGKVSDCITGYSANSSNRDIKILNNIVIKCGNNAIHWGGDHVQIIGNWIYNPTLYGILASRSPNSSPTLERDIEITDNHFFGQNLQSNQGAVSVRNATDCRVNANTISDVHIGIELYATAQSEGGKNCSVENNTIKDTTIGIWLRKNVRFSQIQSNSILDSKYGVVIDSNNGFFDKTEPTPSQNNTIFTNYFDNTRVSIQQTPSSGSNTFYPQLLKKGSGSPKLMAGKSICAYTPNENSNITSLKRPLMLPCHVKQ